MLQTSVDITDPGKNGVGDVAVELPTVGQRLRTARERAGLSVIDIAQSLKFSPRQIEALEADDHAVLPGNTIIRGFIRSYGRFLKLDVDALLHALDLRTPSAPADVRPPDNMGVANQPGETRQLSAMMSVAIVLLLAAILLGVWHFLGPNISKSTTVAGKQNDTAPSAAPPVFVPKPEVARDAIALPAGNTPGGVSPGMTDNAAVSPPTRSVAAPAAPSGAPLLFVFHGRSWLEVADATQQKLHSGENPAGSRLTLAGRPPFEIVVGNATKVSLTYGARVIDLTPYTRADVARLTLE